jgi:hypothetical protein
MGLSPRWLVFNSRPHFVRQVVKKVSPEEIFLRVLQFSSMSIISLVHYTVSYVQVSSTRRSLQSEETGKSFKKSNFFFLIGKHWI